MYRFRKLTSIALAVLMLVSIVSLAACQQAEKKDTSLADIKAKGKIIMGLDDAFPPMAFRDEADNTKIVGFDVDLATEVFKRMEIEVVLRPIDWTQKINELNTGNIDVIWNGFTILPDRLEQTSMTDPYMINRQVLVVMGDSDIQTLEDLAGKEVGLQAESSAADALAAKAEFKDSLADVVEFKDNMTALMDLEIGGTDAVLMDEIVANFYISAKDKGYRILDEALADEDYGIGFRKGSDTLRDEVQKVLVAMVKDGTAAQISQKWFGKDVVIIGK